MHLQTAMKYFNAYQMVKPKNKNTVIITKKTRTHENY